MMGRYLAPPAALERHAQTIGLDLRTKRRDAPIGKEIEDQTQPRASIRREDG